jgi:hypothetical protein
MTSRSSTPTCSVTGPTTPGPKPSRPGGRRLRQRTGRGRRHDRPEGAGRQGVRQAGRAQALTDIVWPGIRKLATEKDLRVRNRREQPGGARSRSAVRGWLGRPGDRSLGGDDRAGTRDSAARKPERNGLDEAAARARIDSQLSNDERTARADVVIENNGTIDELKKPSSASGTHCSSG